MTEIVGKKDEFDDLFVKSEEPPEGDSGDSDVVETEVKGDDTQDVDVEPVDSQPENKTVDAPEVKTDQKPKLDFNDLPPEVQQAIQFRQQFEQFVPMVQGFMNMSEKDKQDFYRRAQGLPPVESAPQKNPLLDNNGLPISEELLKEADEYIPGLGKAVMTMAQELAEIKKNQQDVSSKFKSQEEIMFREKAVEYKNSYEKQWSKLTSEHPELGDDDFNFVRSSALGYLQEQLNKGNVNATVDLYAMGKAYVNRLSDVAKKKQKAPAGASNKQGVQSPPATLHVDVEKDFDKAKSMDDVFDIMFKGMDKK